MKMTARDSNVQKGNEVPIEVDEVQIAVTGVPDTERPPMVFGDHNEGVVVCNTESKLIKEDNLENFQEETPYPGEQTLPQVINNV